MKRQDTQSFEIKEQLHVKIQKSARNVVRDYLKIRPQEEVVIIFEEKNIEVAESLAYEAISSGADVLAIPIFKYQRKVLKADKKEMYLNKKLRQLLNNVDVIITLIEKYIGELNYRRSILESIENGKCRIAHMPGMQKEYFAEFMHGDFESILSKGTFLYEKLADASMRELRVQTDQGTELSLVIPENIILTTGLIDKPGTLGNLPGGEVYFAPVIGSANGRIVIDLAVPDTPLTPQKKIVIPIEGGLANVDNIIDPEGLTKEFFKEDGSQVLCEFGIGLNDDITEPTGTVLIDEKMGGTVHVAFGDNTFFGGNNRANIHVDMVMKAPTLVVGGETLMKKGQLVNKEGSILKKAFPSMT